MKLKGLEGMRFERKKDKWIQKELKSDFNWWKEEILIKKECMWL